MIVLRCGLCKEESAVHPTEVRTARRRHDREAHPDIERRRVELEGVLRDLVHPTQFEPDGHSRCSFCGVAAAPRRRTEHEREEHPGEVSRAREVAAALGGLDEHWEYREVGV
ncbi:MAG: hypothetical protein KJ048_17345 [Dehalococcoidia bacterium]|nr:hypothetical protein [Dehalococcoidia bacterium]